MSIEITNISKTFGRYCVLKEINLHLVTGELVALLGPSGCGKTTLLRIVAGLDRSDPGSGTIRFYDKDVVGQSPRERRVGFVFQHYTLFRHMTVFENIAFGLRMRRPRLREAVIREKVYELLQLIQMEPLARRHPYQLSGGQSQRVALARALAVEPRILLLDEPFGALDAKVRQQLRQWLRHLHDEIRVTSLLVTHDQEEALEVADRIVVLNEGRVEQMGTPTEVFNNPVSEFVMRFFGHVNLFHGRLEGERPIIGHDVKDPIPIWVRPHELEIETSANDGLSAQAMVVHVFEAGALIRVELRGRAGQIWFADMTHENYHALSLNLGQHVHVRPRQYRVFPKTGPEKTSSRVSPMAAEAVC
ncbi:MAG: sulfate/molybdate ABC transporter ATP-binding protein [Elusimicrobia bacterium]|nr:sulfate/molybdate ABC transporter ATP-binding protein [Candidatus Obscuribacterium magneticum]